MISPWVILDISPQALMDLDFERGAKRLEKEQAARRSRAKATLEKKAYENTKYQVTSAIAAEQAARARRERLEAEARKEEEREAELRRGGGILYSKTLPARLIPKPGPHAAASETGNRVVLPPSVLSDLEASGAEFPYFFEVLHKDKNTFVGVLEFSCEKEEVLLPSTVFLNLGVDLSSLDDAENRVTLKYSRLPKGKAATFQTVSDAFFDIPDHRAMLEATLQSRYVSLKSGDAIALRHQTGVHAVVVSNVEPMDMGAISIIDTDLAVDIVPTSGAKDSLPRDASASASTPAAMDTSGGAVPIPLGQSVCGHTSSSDAKLYKFTVLDNEKLKEVVIAVDMGTSRMVDSNADISVFVDMAPYSAPGQGLHRWRCTDSENTKEVKVRAVDEHIAVEGGTYYVCVIGYSGRVNYTVRVERKAVENNGPNNEETPVCDNCLQSIPAQSMVMHQLHCSRNTFKCEEPGCGQIMPSTKRATHIHCPLCCAGLDESNRKKHEELHHRPIICSEGCNAELVMDEMTIHKKNECINRSILCRFCGDIVRAGGAASDAKDRMHGLSEHEGICGSRTSPCADCGAAIRLKEMNMHRLAFHNDGNVEDLMRTPIPTTVIDSARGHEPIPSESPVESTAEQVSPPPPSADDPMDVSQPLRDSGRHFVSCPICSEDFPSERHVSIHIDKAH